MLVNNRIITYYSDEEYKDNAEIVRISKQEDYILYSRKARRRNNRRKETHLLCRRR